MKREQHIPTFIGLIILLVGISAGIFLNENKTVLLTQASSQTTPQEVTVSNVNENSFTVSWFTNSPTISAVTYTDNSPLTAELTAYDARGKKARHVHTITVGDLKPTTTYSFKIVSQNKIFVDSRFSTTTGIALASPIEPLIPTNGTLLDSRNRPVREALVYTSFDGSQTLSGVVRDGSWAIPLAYMRSRDLSRYFQPEEDTELFLQFNTPQAESVVYTTLKQSTGLAVELGKNVDLRPQENTNRGLVIAQTQTNTQLSGSITSNFTITQPKNEAGITGTTPQIKGTGSPAKQVALTLTGGKIIITDSVTVDGQGSWNWTPKQKLSPQRYVLTAISTAANQKTVSDSIAFTLHKSGSQVLQAATPAASLAPSPSASASATPKASATASATPVPTTGSTQPTQMLFMVISSLLGVSFVATGFAYAKNKRMTTVD